jgi:hypothetical protein
MRAAGAVDQRGVHVGFQPAELQAKVVGVQTERVRGSVDAGGRRVVGSGAAVASHGLCRPCPTGHLTPPDSHWPAVSVAGTTVSDPTGDTVTVAALGAANRW